MDWHAAALIGAGVIGGGVAVFHGVLVQRLMIAPLAKGGRLNGPALRLVPPLLQFTTFNWLLGGVALVAAALWLQPQARLVAAILVGSSYLFGAVGNFWGTRGRHPGWVLYAIAVGLIGYGVS